MSFEYYSKWWIKAKKEFEDLYQADELIRKKAKPMKDRTLANELIGGLFAKFSLAVQNLDACLDQMAQPQKRTTVRKLMDAATIRLQELNNELKKIDISEYHYIDGSLIELKLVPYDVEILHPALMFPRPVDVEDLVKKIKNGERIYTPPPPPPKEEVHESEEQSEGTEKIKESGETKEEHVPSTTGENDTKAIVEEPKKAKPPSKKKLEEKVLTPEEEAERKQKEIIYLAVRMIQTMERAREARLYVDEKSEHRQRIKALASGKQMPTPPDEEAKSKAVLDISRYWRGHADRQAFKRAENRRRLLIGMTEVDWKSNEEFEIFERNLEKRRELRDQRIREYIQANLDEKARLLRVVGPGLFEDIGDEIREWFHQWYLQVKCFDDYPPEDKGGSILIVRGETLTPKEYIDKVESDRREKEKNKGKDKKQEKEKAEKAKKEAEKKKKEAEKKKKEAEAKKKKKKKPSDFELEFEPTMADPLYNAGELEHKEIWDNINDFDNPTEAFYMDMIHEQRCYEVQLEVREKVDEMMRLELEMLEAALEEDRSKNRFSKKKKKKKGKKKRKKGRKGKKKKDPTGNRTTEDLFQELVDNGIIRTYPNTRLHEYHGDFSYNNWELRNLEFDPPATLLDVRQAVILNCIMPLGVETMKRPKSVLIAGPRQSGKHLLANAVFNESKCVLFDLSAEVLAGKYPGNKGMKMLVHLVNKMGRILAPSILFIDGAERVFYKKVPKEERELEPKRLGKVLIKGIVKGITPLDRMMVLGISGKPWAGTAGKIKKAFEKAILIPKPDYGSIYLYWRELLNPYHGVSRDFNYTSLTTATRNYPFPLLKEAANNVLTPRRIIQFAYNPLRPGEIYEYFVSRQIEPITDKEYKKFTKWYDKTPLGKERKKFNKYADQKREQEAKAAEKSAQKGKK